MRTVQEYLKHAEECDALAARALSPEQRDTLTQMAETWRSIARQREKLILSGGPLAIQDK